MANEGRNILLALLTGIGLTGFYLVMGALFPRVIQRSLRAADRSPGRSLLVGLVNILFFSVLGLGFASLAENSGAGVFQLVAVLLFGLLALLLAFGLTAMVQLIGGRMLPGVHQTWQSIAGGWALLLGSLTPFIGWFILLPYLAMVATGSVLLGWVRRRRPPADPGQELSAEDTA
jgi:hypothetical protein